MNELSQKEMMLAAIVFSEPKELDWSLVKLCKTEQEAMRLCIRKSPRYCSSQRDLSIDLGFKSSSALNSILSSDYAKRVRNMSRTMQIKLQRLCGNKALDQWAEMYSKGLLISQRSDTQETIYALKEQLIEQIALLNKVG